MTWQWVVLLLGSELALVLIVALAVWSEREKRHDEQRPRSLSEAIAGRADT